MADDNTPEPNDEYAKIHRKVDEFITSHKHATADQVESFKTEIKRMMADADDLSRKEREELKSQLEELKKWRLDKDKAEEEREKVKSSSGTLVVPPNDVEIQQTTVTVPAQEQTNDEDSHRRGGWRRFW